MLTRAKFDEICRRYAARNCEGMVYHYGGVDSDDISNYEYFYQHAETDMGALIECIEELQRQIQRLENDARNQALRPGM